MKFCIKLFLIFHILFQTVNIAKADVDNNSIKSEIKKLIGECGKKFKNHEYDSALFFIDSALIKVKHVRDSHLFLVCYNYKGVVLKSQSKYNLCLQAYNNALRYLPDDEYNINRLKLLLNIAVVHRMQGQFSKALLVLDDALKNSESYPLSSTLASCFDEFAIILKDENSNRALVFLNKALTMRKELGNKKSIAKSYNHLGSFYNMNKDYSKALFHYRNSLKIHDELKSSKSISIACTNIGNLYLRIEKLDSAKMYYNRSLDIKVNIRDRNGEAVVCAAMGELYAKTNNYYKAETYLVRAKKIAEEIEVLYLQQEIYLQLKNLYAAQNKSKKALAYYDKYIAVKDSIFSIFSTENLQEMETRYQIRENSQKMEVLNIEKEAKEQENRYMKIVLAVFLFSLLPLAYVVKQLQKNKLLEERISGENQECNRISRELHDGVASSLSHLCRSMENDHTDQNFVGQLRSISDEVRGISHQLNITAIAAQDFRAALSDSLPLNRFLEGIDLQIDMAGNFDIYDYKVKVNLIRIVQELVNNSLKHAQASTIIIKFRQEKKHLCMEYADDGIGIGMDTEKVSKGNGWLNIKERVAYLSGKMDVVTSRGDGFYIKVVI